MDEIKTEINNEEVVERAQAQKSANFIYRNKNRFSIFLILLLMVGSFIAGSTLNPDVDFDKLGINILNQEPPEGVTDVDYELLWKAIKVVSTKYVDNPVDQKELMYGAVSGMISALGDPYSVFFPPKENEEFNQELQGNFEGIGAEIAVKENTLVVVSPLPDSPAIKAGLRAGDIILKIDDEEVVDPNINEAVSKIRGPKGTVVSLTIFRKGESEALLIPITRDSIHVESVTTEVKNYNGKKILVAEINRFAEDTSRLFAEKVNKDSAGGIDGIVVDLRNNPGGYLQASIELSSFWLDFNSVVLREIDANDNEFPYYSTGENQFGNLPTVVLINEGSASASEIVAGALQDHKVATIIGEKSYGKGSVQDLVDLGSGSAIKITIAKWLTPDGRSINKEGIEPDIKVEYSTEDFEADRDPQMDKALEVLGD